ncbi:MAG: hypothetical protein RLZZ574_3237 [Cyanobacteriota bacterium]
MLSVSLAMQSIEIRHMKLFDTVAIVCDHSLLELATAIRAPLELMRLQVQMSRKRSL